MEVSLRIEIPFRIANYNLPDIHPGNILFRIPTGCELPLDDIYQGDVYRKDGTPLEEGIPKYVVAPLSQGRDFKERLEKFTDICLIDFSTCKFP